MAYFLKKSNLKKGTYLQIYESFYDPERGGTAHKSYKALGYVDDIIASGIDDPISFYKEEVTKLNQQFQLDKAAKKARQISDETPERLLGYFPLKNINDSLGVSPYIRLMQTATDLRFDVYSMLSSLVYARAVMPCSKLKTFTDVLPKLPEECDFSLDQIYSGLEYIGLEYEKIIEIYNHQIAQRYPFDTSHTYFDCTNFYFEIDREDDFRRKGVSKENRHEPLVGLGLLLDANQIPIGMKVYPGNASEKPLIREVIDGLKTRNSISGRTIQVADKGLNCADNIFHAREAGDGYIFSRSVKMLSDVEQTWVLLDNDYRDIKDSKGRILYRIKECVDDFPYKYKDGNGREITIKVREKRVATFNPSLARKQTVEINRLVEKAKGLRTSEARRSEYGDSARFVKFVPKNKNGKDGSEDVKVILNNEAIDKALSLAGYNLLVTSETRMSPGRIYAAYHNLWRIEESFRIMKSQLDARPVYLHKEETITAHFLICYLAVLLLRILQFKILKDNYCSEDIMGFIKGFRVARISDRQYLNLTKDSAFIKEFAKHTNLPLTSYFLSGGEIKKMLSHRF